MSDTDPTPSTMPDDMTTQAGRPRAFDETVVLDRAVDLFWRSGYRSTTTRFLETELGVSQSSLYNAFGSKQGLMNAALDRYESMTGEALLTPLEGSERGLEGIGQFFDGLVEWVTGDGRGGCMIINLMAEEGDADPAVSERTAAYRTRVRNALRASLARAVDAGEATPGHVDVRADLLFGEVLGINVAARGGAGTGEVERLAAAARFLIESWRL